MKLTGAVQVVKIGCAMQESLGIGAKIWFDETGSRAQEVNGQANHIKLSRPPIPILSMNTAALLVI